MTDMFISPGTPNANQSYSGAFGNDFQITGDTYINAYVFYYDPAHSAGYPTRLSIWNRTNTLRMWTTTSLPTAPSVAGWVTVAVSPQLTLTDTSKTYQCCQSANWFWGWTSGAPSVASGFTGVAPKFQNGEPATAAGGWVFNAEYVGTANTTGGNGGSSGSTGEGAPTFTGDLEAWESNDSTKNLHQSDGLPWLTNVDTADTRTKVTNGLNLAGGLQALSDSLAHTLQMASDYVAGRTSTYFTDIKNRLIGASGGGGSAFFGPDGTQVSAGVEALLARSTNAQVGFPASPWEKTAETDFDGCLAWDQPADLYTVVFATTPPTIPDNGQCGVPVRYRLAWWTPLNGEFAQERHWIDFEKVHLVDPAGRVPGLLLQTYYGGTGHVEAWTLNV